MKDLSADKLQETFGELSNVYARLEKTRKQKESIWKDCASLTLPYLFPSESLSEGTVLPTPYNSIGANAVNTLSSKLLIALLPPTGQFFRLIPYKEAIEGMSQEQLQQADSELAKLEKDISNLIAIQGLRVPIFEAIKMLVTIGNCMLYKVPNNSFKVFSPYQYVINRDFIGKPMTMCIKEKIDKKLLPEDFQKQINAKEEYQEDEDIDIYTGIFRVNQDDWIAYQEVDSTVLEKTIVKYKSDTLPYMPLRWTSILNEDYGRGLVEQYIGDLRTLEGLSQVILEGSATMAKVVFGRKPASTVKIDDIVKAKNGGIVEGDLEKDISVLRVDKTGDFQIPYQLMQSIEQRIGRAFLMVGGAIRDSERTTSTEVRATTAELEATLGGVYSVMAQEMQLPLIKILLQEINPKALKVTVPSITVGANAISRERDLQNLTYMLQSLGQLGPEILGKYLKIDGYITEIANSLGIDPYKIVRSPEEIAQIEQQQMQAQQGVQKTIPQGVM